MFFQSGRVIPLVLLVLLVLLLLLVGEVLVARTFTLLSKPWWVLHWQQWRYGFEISELEEDNDKSSKLTEPMLVMKRNKYQKIIPAGFDSVKHTIRILYSQNTFEINGRWKLVKWREKEWENVKKFKPHIFSPFVELIYKEKLTSVKFGWKQ